MTHTESAYGFKDVGKTSSPITHDSWWLVLKSPRDYFAGRFFSKPSLMMPLVLLGLFVVLQFALTADVVRLSQKVTIPSAVGWELVSHHVVGGDKLRRYANIGESDFAGIIGHCAEDQLISQPPCGFACF
ncbi:MAG: hypothetical protein AB1744_09350, partial [Candidatus Zixiibacteriota bacterium]